MAEHTSILPQTQATAAAVKVEVLPVQTSIKENIYTESLQRLPIQPKLSIGAIDDPLEDEADTVADKVMRMPQQNFIQRKCRGRKFFEGNESIDTVTTNN